MTLRSAQIVAVLPVVIFVALWIRHVVQTPDDADLQKGGRPTTATLLDKTDARSKELRYHQRIYLLRFSYPVGDKTTMETVQYVGEDVAGNLHVGGQVPAFYDPQNPSSVAFLFASYSGQYRERAIAGGIGILLLWCLIVRIAAVSQSYHPVSRSKRTAASH